MNAELKYVAVELSEMPPEAATEIEFPGPALRLTSEAGSPVLEPIVTDEEPVEPEPMVTVSEEGPSAMLTAAAATISVEASSPKEIVGEDIDIEAPPPMNTDEAVLEDEPMLTVEAPVV